MSSGSCSTDGRRAALRAFAATLGRAERLQVAVFVLASLLAAATGSLAALLLVPLFQPGAPLPFGDGLFDSPRSIEGDAALFATAMALFALLRWSGACLGARLAAHRGMALRSQVHSRLAGARLAALADSTSAEIANVLTYNVEVVVHGFSAALQLLVAFVTTVVTLAFAAWVAPPLLLALPVFAAFGWMAARLFGREQARSSREYVADMTGLFWRGEDFPRRLRHVRSFGRQHADDASWAGVAQRLARANRRQLELAAHGRLLLELLATLAIAGGFVVAHRWSGIDQATLIAVCLLLGRLLPYLASTRQGIQQLRSALPALELWHRYMALDPEPPIPAITAGDPDADARRTLRIRRLRLPPALVALEVRDLVLAPGQLTLVCGDSGIGKSCLVDILAGMATPAVFEAEVAGRPIGFDEYRALVARGAYVSQQVRPWHANVRECLHWAAPGADDGALWQALADVGLAKRLQRSPRGLETALHDSASRLSGGELQRLLLAQVLLREPTLAMLDEATGALDAASEREVLGALRARLPRTVLVVVSHRRGLAALADQCLVLDDRALAGVRPGRPAGTTP